MAQCHLVRRRVAVICVLLALVVAAPLVIWSYEVSKATLFDLAPAADLLNRVPAKGGDVPGRDFEGVPRLPGSERMYCRESREGDVLVYSAVYKYEFDAVTARRLLEKAMVDEGWRPIGSEGASNLLIFYGRDGDDSTRFVQLFFRPHEESRSIVYVVAQEAFQDVDR